MLLTVHRQTWAGATPSLQPADTLRCAVCQQVAGCPSFSVFQGYAKADLAPCVASSLIQVAEKGLSAHS